MQCQLYLLVCGDKCHVLRCGSSQECGIRWLEGAGTCVRFLVAGVVRVVDIELLSSSLLVVWLQY